MKVELDNFVIFTDKKLDYLEDIERTLNNETKEILNFFELSALKEKKNVVIYGDIQKYKSHIEQTSEYQEWMCGDTDDGNINLLELSEVQKTKAHKNDTLETFLQTIIHEFVHVCQQEVKCDYEGLIWFWEALATNLSKQERKNIDLQNCDFDKLKNDFSNVKNGYGYAYVLGNYMLETYGQKKVLDYVKNPDKLRQDEDNIFESAKKAQMNQEKNKDCLESVEMC